MKKFKELKKNLYTSKTGKFDYKKFSDDRKKHPEKFIAGLEESRYGDAMSSRLPSHLEDPRHEPVKPSESYLKAKKKRELHFANKGAIRVKKSVYESYRDQALEEAALDVPTSSVEAIADKHGRTVEFVEAQLKRGIEVEHEHTTADRTAREIALDHLGEKADYYTKLDKAKLEEARLHHVLKGHPYHHKTDAELHYIIKDAAEAEKAIGTHDKKAMWKYGDQQNDAASILGYRQRGGKQIPEPKRVYTEERTPHAGEVFVDPFDKHTIHSYHGAGAKEKRDAYAKYLRSIGSTVKSYSHADDQSYHVMRGHHVTEMTERESASHQDRIGSTLDANKATKLDKFKRAEVSHIPKAAVQPLQTALRKLSGHPINVSMGKGKSVPMTMKEDAPHAGHVMNFSDRMEHQFFGAEEARKDRDAYAKHLKSQGKKVKLGSLRNQILHGSYGHVYHVTHKRTMEESVGSVPNAAFNEDGNDPNYKPTRPERRRAITHPTVRVTKKELDREKKELGMHGDFRDKLKESWSVGDVKSVAAKHGYEFSHTQHSGAKVYAHSHGHMLVDDPKTKHWHHYHKDQAYTLADKATTGQGLDALNAHLGKFHGKGRTPLAEESSQYKVGDHVVPKIGPHKGEVHRVIHVHPTGHVNIKPEHATGRRNRYHLGAAKADPKDLEDAPGHGSKKLEEAWKDKSLTTCSAGMSFNDAVAHATKHGGRVTYGTASRKWHSLSPDDRDYDTSFAIDPQEAKRQGMAKSLLGSTSAHRLEEGADTVDNLTAAAKRFKTQVEADAYYKKHPKELNKKQSLGTRLPGLESKRYRNLAENPIVREAFEAAKAKKKNGDDSFAGKDAKATDFKPNDFQEPKDLKSPGQQDPQQAPVQGQPPQFGGKDQKSPEKQSNAPKPEKKTDKLTVKGPGPEDAFQTEPTVAGLTTLVKA